EEAGMTLATEPLQPADQTAALSASVLLPQEAATDATTAQVVGGGDDATALGFLSNSPPTAPPEAAYSGETLAPTNYAESLPQTDMTLIPSAESVGAEEVGQTLVPPEEHSPPTRIDVGGPRPTTAGQTTPDRDFWQARARTSALSATVEATEKSASTRGDRVVSAAPDGYELLGELGRGAMGVVYKARQRGLNRLVALKMVLSGAHASEHQLARFHTEAEAVARLQHVNIVQIHEVGERDGLPFFSLEYVD